MRVDVGPWGGLQRPPQGLWAKVRSEQPTLPTDPQSPLQLGA